MKKISFLFCSILLSLLASCAPSVPDDAIDAKCCANVYPDNANATLPPNIAPLNFMVSEGGEDCVVRIHGDKTSDEILVQGPMVEVDVDDWHSLLQKCKGGNVYTDIYVKADNGKWYRYNTITNPVAQDECDEFVTYRLIEPSYVDYEGMSLVQRNVTNFEEHIVYSNRMQGEGDNGQCINCHVAQDYNRNGHSQFHVRQYNGGTLLLYGKSASKVNLNTDSTLAAGVYPAWHPKANLIAYSVNETGQVFHTRNIQKIEVIDYASDLILYDVDANKVYDIDKRKDEFETFPTWSPDGQTLYFASVHYEQKGDDIDNELNTAYQSLKYNVYARQFNQKTMKFGERRLVLDASAIGKSAAFPRISPDGRYMLVALADYGQFHIWHHSSDLYVLDLKTNSLRPLAEANSLYAESYHNWSSNGRWILFASRREDGNYTRLYMSYFDKQGKIHKPVLLPQKSADTYKRLFKSFNVPEWMVKGVKADMMRIENSLSQPAMPAQYAGSALEKPDACVTAESNVYVGKANIYK